MAVWVDAVRAAMIAVFGIAVWQKTASADNFRRFSISVETVSGRHSYGARVRPVLIIAGEGAVVGLLIMLPAAGLVGAAVMLFCFALAIARAVRRDIHASCECFGADGGTLGVVHIVRNVTLGLAAAGAAGAAFLHAAPVVPGNHWLAAIVAGGLIGILATRIEDIVYVAVGRIV